MPNRSDAKPLRVVQWATGNVGTGSLRAVIRHPRMELVGLHVHSPDKVGRDAGELAGLDKVGVAATGDISAILALKPDCVLYMQQGTDLDAICRLLEGGVNIVTTRGDFANPAAMDPAVRARVEAACRKGGASIHSTGSSPGFITEAVPIVLTSLQRRLDGLTIDEFADLSSRDSPDLLFNIMGYGRPPENFFSEQRLGPVRANFADSLNLLADTLSLPLDSVEVFGEVATVKAPLTIAAGVIEAGMVAAQRITVAGMKDGRQLLRFRANWYCTREVDVDWDLRESGWQVLVEGDTPLDVSIRFPIPLEQYAEMTPGLTAHRAVNAVSVVCAAEPGIRSTADLPQVIADLG